MKAARIVATTLLCLGLGVPSAHGMAVCVDMHGNLSLEAAVGGACAGTAGGERSPAPLSQSAPGFQAHATDDCGGCRDVIISGSDIGPPVKANAKTHRASADDGGASPLFACVIGFEGNPNGRPGSWAASLMPHSPPAIRTVVLRL